MPVKSLQSMLDRQWFLTHCNVSGDENAEVNGHEDSDSSDGDSADSDDEEEVRFKQAINPDREIDAEFEAELAAMNLTDSTPHSAHLNASLLNPNILSILIFHNTLTINDPLVLYPFMVQYAACQ